MAVTPIGVCRTPRPEGMEDDATVREELGGTEWTVTESVYRYRGYQPPYEDLKLCHGAL